jgi:hypothetical protein
MNYLFRDLLGSIAIIIHSATLGHSRCRHYTTRVSFTSAVLELGVLEFGAHSCVSSEVASFFDSELSSFPFLSTCRTAHTKIKNMIGSMENTTIIGVS